MSLTIYYQNVRGLRSKTRELLMAVNRNNYDIIILTETWLRDGIFNGEILDDRYKLFRRDRDATTSSKSDGGGVLIAIKKSSNYFLTHRSDLQSNSEDVIVTIKHKRNNKIIQIIGVYLPTEARKNDIRNFTENFIRMRESLAEGCFILCGDFNLPSQTQSNAQLLNDLFSFCDLEQFNDVRNKFNGAMLDLVLSNRVVKVSPSIDQLSKIDVYHPPIVITTPFEACLTVKQNSKFRNFKRISWNHLNDDLMNIHWEETFANAIDVNEKVELFYEKLSQTLDDHCPIISAKNRKHPKWFSKESILLLKKKTAHHRNWRKH